MEKQIDTQKDTDLLGNELRRRIGLLILQKPELGYKTKKDFVRKAVGDLLDQVE